MRRIYFLLLIFNGCEDGNPLRDPITNVNMGESHTDTLIAYSDTFIVKGKVNNGESSKLLLGSYENFTTRFLIRFNQLTADTNEIISARLMLKSTANFGAASESFTGNIYVVQEEWQDSGTSMYN